MARNASGTYSLPAGNPVVTATVISSTWANTTLDDLKTEMTDSLSRSGKGGMLAALGLVDGSAGAPALSFSNETSTGIFRPAANQLGFAVAGAQRLVLRTVSAALGHSSPLAAGDAGNDVALDTTNARTAGNLLSVTTAGGARFRVSATGIVGLANSGTVQMETANSPLTLKGNRDAADAGTDIIFSSTATRTTGRISEWHNNGALRLRVDYDGSLVFPGGSGLQIIFDGNGLVTAAQANTQLNLRGNRNAADAGADVVVNTVATRTAGSLFRIDNNNSSRLQLDASTNRLVFTSGGSSGIQTNVADQRVCVFGNRNAASTTEDVNLGSLATRTDGQLVRIDNNGTLKASVLFNGVVNAPNVMRVSETTADDTVTGTTGQAVTGLSFPVSASADYYAEFTLLANTSATATHQVQFTGPAAPTKVRMGSQGLFGSTLQSGFGTTAYSSAFEIQPANVTSEAFVRVYFVLRNGANSGTVQLLHNSNTAGQSATIFAGSNVRWQRVDNAGTP